MKYLVLAIAASLPIPAASQDPGAVPALPGPAAEETLVYTVNWPSGLSLGESRMLARRAGDRWDLEFVLEAAVPGFDVNDQYRSVAAADYCSLEFEKRLAHGKKKARERTSFDIQKGLATRETLDGGGKTEIPFSACARDGLAFLYHLRRELSQGRLPAVQNVFFGAQYRVSVQYAGSQTLRISEKPADADRLTVLLKGPASEHTVELFFARDAPRTLLMARLPLELGTFSMELVR